MAAKGADALEMERITDSSVGSIGDITAQEDGLETVSILLFNRCGIITHMMMLTNFLENGVQ